MKIEINGKKQELTGPVTAQELAKKAKMKSVLAVRIDGELRDLSTEIPDGAKIEFVDFSMPEGREIYWHSASHLLAQAVLELYPDAKLAIGPSIAEGFYYDFDVAQPFTPEDIVKIEKKMKQLIKQNIVVEHYYVPRADALSTYDEMGEVYKVELIEGLADEEISFYRQGKFFDLCRGPHLASTGKLKAFKLLRIAGAYWRGDETKPMLQRIYGIAFPTQDELQDYQHRIEEAKKRDHRKLGKELGLFSFHEEGPGFPFWHDKGTTLFNLLIEYIRVRLKQRNYQEVKTPLILNESLWHRSGHWDNFKENMYFTDIDNGAFAVKPMNCPGGLLLYKEGLHSYRELPLRMAEFGLVHRHELSGVLHGLMRVRSFTQDDAHSFCLPDQVEAEVIELINLTVATYRDFDFNDYTIYVATRPEKALGDPAVWERATRALTASLDRLGLAYQIKEGEGAFYGPKIEFDVRDSLKRDWQLGTIQVDFSMPERFDLEYVGSDGNRHRPVMIHRAIFGSFERFIGILIEHYAGAFPAWLAPIQARVITISPEQQDYAHKVKEQLSTSGLRAELDLREEKLGYKIREARLARIPYILVIGKAEADTGTVNLRTRDGQQQSMEMHAAVEKLTEQSQPPQIEV